MSSEQRVVQVLNSSYLFCNIVSIRLVQADIDCISVFVYFVKAERNQFTFPEHNWFVFSNRCMVGRYGIQNLCCFLVTWFKAWWFELILREVVLVRSPMGEYFPFSVGKTPADLTARELRWIEVKYLNILKLHSICREVYGKYC